MYCTKRDAVTGDHVFAREFFLPSERVNLPQAPACAKWNNKKSKLEHYLTAVLPFGGRHSAATQNLASMVPKRLSKNLKLDRALVAGRQKTKAPSEEGDTAETMTIPIDGDRVKQLFAMVARGLIWFHWNVYLSDDCEIKSMTVTHFGEQYFDQLVFRRNAKDRVKIDLGHGTFEYEGVLAKDNSELTAWRCSIYGGLSACEEPDSPESFGSRIIVITGPSPLITIICRENANA